MTFTVTNTTTKGPGSATNTTVRVTFPGAGFVSARPTRSTCTATSPTSIRCVAAQLKEGESETITVDVQPERTGRISLNGRVTADQVDIEAGNNSVVGTTTVTTP